MRRRPSGRLPSFLRGSRHGSGSRRGVVSLIATIVVLMKAIIVAAAGTAVTVTAAAVLVLLLITDLISPVR